MRVNKLATLMTAAIIAALAPEMASAVTESPGGFSNSITISSDHVDCTPTIGWDDGGNDYAMTYTVVQNVGTLEGPVSLPGHVKKLVISAPDGCVVPDVSKLEASTPLPKTWGPKSALASTINGGIWVFMPFLSNAYAIDTEGTDIDTQITTQPGAPLTYTGSATASAKAPDGETMNNGNSTNGMFQTAPGKIAVVAIGASKLTNKQAEAALFPRSGNYVAGPYSLKSMAPASKLTIEVGVVVSQNPLKTDGTPDTDLVVDTEVVRMPTTITVTLA